MNDDRVSFGAHLGELKRRVIYTVLFLVVSVGVALAFHRVILSVLLHPLTRAGGEVFRLDLIEFWATLLKASVVAGIAATVPFALFQAVRFVSPGLKPHERRWLIFLVPGAVLSFATGVAFGYFVLLPPAIGFLFSYGSDIATPLISIGKYINLVTLLLFWLGAIFEMPIVMFFLAKIGVVTPEWIGGKRRWAVVLAFVAGAMITPTFDPVNQALVAGPIIVLYEVGYWLARLAVRGRRRAATEMTTG